MVDEFEQQLEQEGYQVIEQEGKFLLVDLLGQFIDSEHMSMESVREYCAKNVFTFY